MSTNIQDFIVPSGTGQWLPLVEQGIAYPGIWVKALRYDAQKHRSPTILLRFEPGASYPYHNHPAGEELFVLEGGCRIEGAALTAGDYLYTPPQYKHAVHSDTGCTLLFVVPEEVEILA